MRDSTAMNIQLKEQSNEDNHLLLACVINSVTLFVL